MERNDKLNISWNSRQFLDEYMPLKHQAGNQVVYDKIRALRIKEFCNTVELVNQGYYITEAGAKRCFCNPSAMVSGTVFYEREFRVKCPFVGHAAIEVWNEDCLAVGIKLVAEGYNPAILNMASRRNPGGGVINGAGAQEETLFRRTNLFQSLYQFAPYANQYGVRKSPKQYPLDRNYGGIYTPGATIFRESEARGYKLMDEPVRMSFISVAGMNRPDLTPSGMIAPWLVEPVKNKMRTILRIGLRHGHDSLVLGALGCGAFRNPPAHVARLFHEVFEEPEFKDKYRFIVFAILDDHNTHKAHNPHGNFVPFAEEFKGMERKPQPSPEELKALQMWVNGAGNSAKRFNGENPIPEKTVRATAESWKTLPMPELHECIPMHHELPIEAMGLVKYGHIPEAMEDHWFMYCDDNTIRYYRSWTGICFCVAQYEQTPAGYCITKLTVNRDETQYNCRDNAHDVALFLALLTEEYGGDASAYWDKAF